MMKGISKRSIHTEEKKKKRKREKNLDIGETIRMKIEEDSRMQVGKKIKEKSSTNIKTKNKDKNLVGRHRPKDEVDLEEQASNPEFDSGIAVGWTVVVYHKGRKKTTESESGIPGESVAQVAVEEKLAKKKRKEVGLDFYRFQKKEAQRNEIMMLQSKFEEDKKRLQ